MSRNSPPLHATEVDVESFDEVERLELEYFVVHQLVRDSGSKFAVSYETGWIGLTSSATGYKS